MSDSDMHEATFIWPEVDPSEVILTGSFDQWSRSFRLTKTASGFEGVVKLPWGERVLYKFIVDGHWTLAQSQPEEPDESGNINNVYECPSKPTLVQAGSSNEKPELDAVESASPSAQLGTYNVENIGNGNAHRNKIADIVGSPADTSGPLREDDLQPSGDVITANPMSTIETVTPVDGLQPDFEEATSSEPAMDIRKSFSPISPTPGVPAEAVDTPTTAPTATSRAEKSESDISPSAAVDKWSIIPVTEVAETVVSVPPVVTEAPTDFKQKTVLPTVPSSLPSEPPGTPPDASPKRGINTGGPKEIPAQPVVASSETTSKNSGINRPVSSIDVIPGSSQPGKNASENFPRIEPSTPPGTGKFGSTRKKRISIFGKVKNLFSNSGENK